MKRNKKLSNIIEALSIHQDEASVEVLERLGTNSLDEDVRIMTSKALINRNTSESLSVVMLKSGKGINDLSSNVAMATINEVLSLQDKTEAMNILSSAAEMELADEVKETAKAVRALMAFS